MYYMVHADIHRPGTFEDSHKVQKRNNIAQCPYSISPDNLFLERSSFKSNNRPPSEWGMGPAYGAECDSIGGYSVVHNCHDKRNYLGINRSDGDISDSYTWGR